MEDQWIFTAQELQQVPSIASGAMSVAEERKHRIYGCTFIQAIGCRLELAQLTISTAMVFFHRFFARESFTVYKYEYIAATCVYLACKVEESSRKASDVATACLQYRSNRGNSDEEKAKIIRVILWHEHILLDILCFDFTVEHPYRFLIDFAEELGTSENTLQAAWAFANDSLRLTLCLLYPPHVIAAGCLLLAYRLNGEQLPGDGDLGKMMEENFDALQDIVRSVMNSYSIMKSLVGSPSQHHRSSNNNNSRQSSSTGYSAHSNSSPNIRTNGHRPHHSNNHHHPQQHHHNSSSNSSHHHHHHERPLTNGTSSSSSSYSHSHSNNAATATAATSSRR